MKREYLLLFILFCITILLLQNCTINRQIKTSPSNEIYSFYRIKFNLRSQNALQRGSILLKIGESERATMVFLSPLNQILFRTYLDNSHITLICKRRKKYWQGNFCQLIITMWNLNLTFKELLDIMQNNQIPNRIKDNQMIQIDILNKKYPKLIKILKKDIMLHLKIFKKSQQMGFNFNYNLINLKSSSLEKIIEN